MAGHMVAGMVARREFRFTDVRRFESIDSTNRWLLDEARAGAPEGVVAVADYQTAGRGRLGRTWDAPPGGCLLCSVLTRPDLPAERLHLVTAAMALAAADVVRGITGEVPEVKWPNDLLLGGRKLAGILAEADLPAVVVGIGLNVTWAPEGAACMGEWVTREEVLSELLIRFDDLYGDWDEVASSYRAQCATVGKRVRVDLGGESFEGVAEAVTPEGHLVVAGRVVTAGDVHHHRALPST
jgi:BirA family biotin operon repressor/biotin-[acetyl-CoA-carboxylase] ligase